MKIRPFTRKDIRGMIAVAKKLPEWPKPTPIDLYYKYGFVAVDGKKIIGFISCSSEDGIPYIRMLRVDPSMYRKGIGTQLVTATEKEAQKAGACLLRVVVMGWTRPFNRAFSDTRKFYKALGFKVAKKDPINVEGEDHWRYYTLEKKWSRIG